jgi:histone H3/H4
MPDFVVKKAISDYAHKKDCNVSGEAYSHLNTAVQAVIDAAIKRAKANKRKTLMGHDF